MSFSGKTQNYLQTVVTNNGFWPDLSLGKLQKIYRIPAEYTEEMVTEYLCLAMANINSRLSNPVSLWQIEGASVAEQVPGETINNESLLVMLYRRAVFARTAAKLMARFDTMHTTASLKDQVKESWDTEQNLLAESDSAVRSILGTTQITAALI